jgi:hypothetical protein
VGHHGDDLPSSRPSPEARLPEAACATGQGLHRTCQPPHFLRLETVAETLEGAQGMMSRDLTRARGLMAWRDAVAIALDLEERPHSIAFSGSALNPSRLS